MIRQIEAEEQRQAAAIALPPALRIAILREYAADFYVWGKCRWIEARHAWGKRFSRDVADARRGHLVNHVFPEYGDLPIDRITRQGVKDWLLRLELSAQSRNHVLFSFRIVLRQATEDVRPA